MLVHINNILKRMLMLIIIILLCFLIFLIDNIIENNNINDIVLEFKDRGIKVYENDTYTYYKVLKKYDYEDCSNVVTNYDDKTIGTTGDIYISNRNPMGDFFITEWISKVAWIGHCGIVYSEDALLLLEIFGNKSKELNSVILWENTWLDTKTPNLVILRCKDIDDNKKESIKNISKELIGSKYNYTFLYSKKRFYCTSLINHIYNEIGIDLNDDSFFNTGADYITDNDTYMIYYKETYVKNNKECYNIYYLSE